MVHNVEMEMDMNGGWTMLNQPTNGSIVDL